MFGDELQVIVNAELNLFAGDGFLLGKPHVLHFFADAVYDHAAFAVRAHQDVVVLSLEAAFAREVAGAELAVAFFDLLLADLAHVAHGMREEALGLIAPPRNGNHFEHRNVDAVRLNKGNVRLGSLGLDDDGLKMGKVFGVVELLLEIGHRDAEAIGDGAKVLFYLRHVLAQQQDAEGGPVVDEHAAVAVQHAAARRDDRNFTDAVALSERVVLVGVDDLEFPETQQEHADHAHDDVGGYGQPRLRQTIVVSKPVRHRKPRARGVPLGLPDFVRLRRT